MLCCSGVMAVDPSSSSGGVLSLSSTGLDPFWNSSSTGAAAGYISTGIPNGLVAYAAICFIGVVVFTAYLTWHFARKKLPPMVGILTFLAWSVEGEAKEEREAEAEAAATAQVRRSSDL